MTPFNAPNILGILLFFSFKDFFTSIDVCEFLACTYVCLVMCVPDACRGQRKAQDALALE